MPEVGTFWGGLAAAIYASVLIVHSALNLFYGWKLYRLFTAVVTALVAAMAGWFLISPHLPRTLGIAVPFLLGVGGLAVAFPVQRVAAFISTGVLSGALALLVGVRYGLPLDLSCAKTIAVGVAGFLAGAIPAAIFLRFFVVFLTSTAGAIGALGGVSLALFGASGAVPPLDTATYIVLVAAWTALTVTGMVFQYRLIAAEKKGAASKS